jgi:hypothetical protein
VRVQTSRSTGASQSSAPNGTRRQLSQLFAIGDGGGTEKTRRHPLSLPAHTPVQRRRPRAHNLIHNLRSIPSDRRRRPAGGARYLLCAPRASFSSLEEKSLLARPARSTRTSGGSVREQLEAGERLKATPVGPHRRRNRRGGPIEAACPARQDGSRRGSALHLAPSSAARPGDMIVGRIAAHGQPPTTPVR